MRGARVSSAQVRVLTDSDVHAHNTFENPRAVQPRDDQLAAGADPLVYRFAPASVTRLQLTLA